MYIIQAEMNNNNTIILEEKVLKMRFLLFFTALLSAIALLYKWRYRVLNIILAVSFLRRLAVSVSMKMPGLFTKKPANSQANH